jgi:hypothetical protein
MGNTWFEKEQLHYKVAELLIRVGATPIIPGWMQLTALYRAGNRKEGEGKRVYKLLLA